MPTALPFALPPHQRAPVPAPSHAALPPRASHAAPLLRQPTLPARAAPLLRPPSSPSIPRVSASASSAAHASARCAIGPVESSRQLNRLGALSPRRMPSGALLSPFPASSAARLSSASSAWLSGSSSARPLPARTSTPPLAPSPFTRHSALLLPRPAVAPNGRGGGRRGNGRVLHPVASVAQGRVVVGAQVQRATVLVAQQPDWTWLGIPADMDAPASPSSSIPPLSARASLQRQARDVASVAAAEERDRLALQGAQIEYRGEGGAQGAQGLGGRGGEGEAGAKGEGRVVGGTEVGGGKARVEWEWVEDQQQAAERAVSNVLRAAVVALGWHGYDQHPLSATAPAPSAPPSTPSAPPSPPLSAQEHLLSLSASAALAHFSSLPPHLMPPPRPPPAPAPMPTQHSGSEGGGGRGLSGDGTVGGERMARESGKGREGHMAGGEGRSGHMESGGASVGANGDGLSRRGGDGSMSTEGTVAAVGGRESDARGVEVRGSEARMGEASGVGGVKWGEGGRGAGEGEGSESALRDALALAIRQRMAAHVGGGLVEGQVGGQAGGHVGGRGERIGVDVEQEVEGRGSGTREVVEAQGAWGGAARREEATDRGLASVTAGAATGRATALPLAAGLPSPAQQQQAQAQQHSGQAPSQVSAADSQQWQQERRQQQAEVAAVQVERAPQSAAEPLPPLPSPARMSKAGLPAPVCAREWALRKLHPAYGRGGPEAQGGRGDGSEVGGEKGTHGSTGRGAGEAGEGVTAPQTAAVGGEDGAGGGRQGEEAAGGGGGRLVPCMEGVRVHGGTLMLLAYGDQEPRVVEHIDAHVTFPALPHSYKRIKPPGSSGKGTRFSTPFHMMPGGAAAGRKEAEGGAEGGAGEGGGGLLRVAVDVDEDKHEWAVTVTAHNLFAPVRAHLRCCMFSPASAVTSSQSSDGAAAGDPLGLVRREGRRAGAAVDGGGRFVPQLQGQGGHHRPRLPNLGVPLCVHCKAAVHCMATHTHTILTLTPPTHSHHPHTHTIRTLTPSAHSHHPHTHTIRTLTPSAHSHHLHTHTICTLTPSAHSHRPSHDCFPHPLPAVSSPLCLCVAMPPRGEQGVSGAVVLEGQRLFLHGVEGRYGHVPLRASGDMDLNQGAGGQYRITAQVLPRSHPLMRSHPLRSHVPSAAFNAALCSSQLTYGLAWCVCHAVQVQPVEANLLMKTLNAKPLPYPLAGSLQGLLFCRGPLDAPIFEGTAELAAEPADVDAAVAAVAGSDAAGAVEAWRGEGAVGAYDRVPVTAATANFTFNTDDCSGAAWGAGGASGRRGDPRGGHAVGVPSGEWGVFAAACECGD
ncbi:unnamed protein product [Closterium sp. Naga37s-1]|nr:unnamed protein product [Closterium sp. Naga37s-1]